MKKFFRVVWTIVLVKPTDSVRLFFGMTNLFVAISMGMGVPTQADRLHAIIYAMTPMWATAHYFWAACFMAYALAVFVGLTGKYSIWSLVYEPIFGWVLWVTLAGVDWGLLGHPGGLTGGAVIATWLLIRYPTHSRASRG